MILTFKDPIFYFLKFKNLNIFGVKIQMTYIILTVMWCKNIHDLLPSVFSSQFTLPLALKQMS